MNDLLFYNKKDYIKDTPKLTLRELECIELLKRGLTAKAIADELCISNRTVEAHFANIKYKFRCNNKRSILEIYAIINT